MTLRDLDKARMAIASGWTGCVFADKHFVPAITEVTTPTPKNGPSRPFVSKQDRIAAQSEAALTEWMASQSPVNIIEEECHEIH